MIVLKSRLLMDELTDDMMHRDAQIYLETGQLEQCCSRVQRLYKQAFLTSTKTAGASVILNGRPCP